MALNVRRRGKYPSRGATENRPPRGLEDEGGFNEAISVTSWTSFILQNSAPARPETRPRECPPIFCGLARVAQLATQENATRVSRHAAMPEKARASSCANCIGKH
jgi:hypothetical protein